MFYISYAITKDGLNLKFKFPKQLVWMASSKKDLLALPGEVVQSAVFVLHYFQKKSRTGIATPRHDIALIRRRLDRAGKIYEDMNNGKIR